MKKPVKTKSKPKPSVKAKTKPKSRKVRSEAIDKKLLRMATVQYDVILGKIATGRKRLDKRINEERRLALTLGTSILSKAKKVRDSLMQASKSRK